MMWRLGLLLAVEAAVPQDEVTAFPGVDGPLASRLYSGYLRAEARGQSFFTHYTLSLSQRDPEADPVLLWQQGSGSGFGVGFLTEVGPFSVGGSDRTGSGLPRPRRNPHSWDQVSNLLVLEHPPGVGFSYCVDAGGARAVCEWDDESQGAAFLASLEAFYASYAEFQQHKLYIVGESYGGLFVPYLLQQLLQEPTTVTARQLQAAALGNACTGSVGASATRPGSCNGPYAPMGQTWAMMPPLSGCGAPEHVVRFLRAHGALSTAQADIVDEACGFPCQPSGWNHTCVPDEGFSAPCLDALDAAQLVVGDFYVYNFYDNCGSGDQRRLSASTAFYEQGNGNEQGGNGNEQGGQTYACGTEAAMAAFCNHPEARGALHLHPEAFYGRPWNSKAFGNDDALRYASFSGCSYSLYPSILARYSILVYNGDFDLCVPWSQNEEWTQLLASEQSYRLQDAWQAWPSPHQPSGYVTQWQASPSTNFTFATVKGAGHMVPQYQPARGFDLLQRFISGSYLDQASPAEAEQWSILFS